MALVIPRATKQTIDEVSKLVDPEDFRDYVMKRLGKLDNVRLMFNTVLIAVYIRNEYRSTKILHINPEEDIWQGKTGLVVKLGPDAFVDDPESGRIFGSQKVEVGEWVAFNINSSIIQMDVNNVPCRLIEDSNIRIVVDDPRGIH